MDQAAKQERRDRELERAYDAAGCSAFKHPGDVLDQRTEAQLVAQFADMLSPVFVYIAKGRLTGTMDMRSWVVLYCTSVNLVGGETIEAGAKRFGVSAPRLYALVKEFKAAVPAMRVGFEKSALHRARIGAARRQAPPGVRNLFSDGSSGGSA
jgi:hypothetical protein